MEYAITWHNVVFAQFRSYRRVCSVGDSRVRYTYGDSLYSVDEWVNNKGGKLLAPDKLVKWSD